MKSTKVKPCSASKYTNLPKKNGDKTVGVVVGGATILIHLSDEENVICFTKENFICQKNGDETIDVVVVWYHIDTLK